MTPRDRLRVSIAAARYLEALERDDQETLAALWQSAAADPELMAAFRDIHAGLAEEQADGGPRPPRPAVARRAADQPPPAPGRGNPGGAGRADPPYGRQPGGTTMPPKSPRDRGQQAWRSAAGPAGGAPRDPKYKWKPQEAADPGSGKRWVKKLLLGLGALGCLVGIVLLVLLLWPTPQATLVGISADPSIDAPHLGLPVDLYGWHTAQKFTDLGKEWSGRSSHFGASPAPPPSESDGSPLRLPADEAELAQWADKLSSRRYDPLVVYVGLHGGTDAEGHPVLFTGKGGRLPVAKLIAALAGLQKKKGKVLILDPGRLPPDPAYGQLHDDFAARVKGLNEEVRKDPNLVVLCGAGDGQRGWESEELQATAFGDAVLRALRGDVDTGGRDVITARALFETAQKKTREWTQTNRPSAQEPFLLPDGEDGLARAANIEVGALPRDKPGPPQPAPFDPRDLAARWKEHDELAARDPGPAAYAPRAWRRYRELLLRYEQAVRAGDPGGAAAKLSAALAAAKAAIDAASERLPLGSAQNSVALWAAVNNGGAVPPPPNDAGLGADKAKLPGSPAERAGYADRLVQQLAADRSQFADRLARSAALLRLFEPDQRPAEAHLPVMVEQFYREVVHQTPPAPPAEWAAAIGTLRHAERAAAGVPDPKAAQPSRVDDPGRKAALYTERVWPLTRAAVLAGDAKRRKADDALFSTDPGARDEAVKLLAEADKDYADAAETARVLRGAFDVRDTVLADLPFLTRWSAERDHSPNAVKGLTDLWQSAHELARDLDALPAKAPPAGTPAAFTEAIKAVGKRAGDVAARYGKLRGEFDELTRRPDVALQREWEAKQQLLRVPLIPAEQRLGLLKNSRQASERLLTEGKHQPNVAGADPKGDARDAAWARGRLARAALGDEAIDEQARANERLPKGTVLDEDLRVLREAPADDADRWGKLAAKVGAGLAGYIGSLSQANPAPGAAADAGAERVSRAAVPLEPLPTGGWEPAAANRRLRWRDFLAGLAERTADDHWYDERYNPAAGAATATTGRYFRVAADRFVKDAQEATAALANVPPFTPSPQLAAKLNAPPLGAHDPPAVTWTSERDRKVEFAADPVPAGFPITGRAVGIRQLGKAEPLLPAGGNPGDRPLLPVGGDRLKLEARMTLDPAVDSVSARVAVAGEFYFRGQRVTQTLAIDLRRRPDLVLSDPLPGPAEKGAMVAVRADPKLERGSVALLIDYSGSMKGSFKDGKELADWRTNPDSKFHLALSAVEAALGELPEKTPLRVRVFSDEEDPKEQSRQVFQAKAWDPAELRKLMKDLRGLTPKMYTPLIRSIETAIERDFDDNPGETKTLVVLTDGADEEAGDNPQTQLARIKRERGALYDALRRRGVQLFVVQVGLSEGEQALSEALFGDLPRQTPPGRVWTARDPDQFRRALLDAIRPKLKLELPGGTTPNDYPRGGWTSRTRGDRDKDDRHDLYWSPVIPGDRYTAYPSSGRRPRPADLRLRDGERMILDFVPDPEAGGIKIRRELYANFLTDVPDRVKFRSDKQWVAAVPGNRVAVDSREPQYRATVFVEQVPPHLGGRGAREGALQHFQPTPPETLLWWDVTPEGAADADFGTVRVRKRYGYAAPAWDVWADNWPRAQAGYPQARLKVWVADPAPEPVSLVAELGHADPYPVAMPGGKIDVRVSAEPMPVPTPGKPTDEEALCLVVRVTHPAGKPVYARFDTTTPLNAKHSYYRLRRPKDDAQPGEYTAVFGPFANRDELTTARLRLEFYPVAPVATDDKLAITLTPPRPDTSAPPEMDYRPKTAPDWAGK